MIDLERVYFLESAMKRTALHVRPQQPESFDELAVCLGQAPLDQATVFEHFSGSRAYDLLTTSVPPLKLVSQRALDTLRGFTGWRSYPVRVVGKDRQAIEGYDALAVTGRCGKIDRTKGRELWRDRPMAKGLKGHQRCLFYFDPATWDGSDIFVPEGMAYTFIVEEVMLALKRAKITNIDMWRLPEC
jgi:hypothetical protein